MIDITITATIRPDLLYRTLKSFYDNCFNDYSYKIKNDNLHIIINIDPVGDTNNYKQHNIIDVCKKFSNNVTYNKPLKPNFTKAVKWVWSRCKSNYVFHLEDDWILTRPIDLMKLISYLDSDEVVAVKLFKKKYPKKSPFTMFDVEYKYNGDDLFIATDSGTQFGLNPTLIKRSYIQEALPLMVDNLNPEKQFRRANPNMKDFVLKYKYGIYGIPGDEAMVIDTGTKWRNKRNIKKPKGTQFIIWE